MKVKDFQSIPVVVEESMTVYDAICHMFLEDVALFVVDKNLYLLVYFQEKIYLRTSIGNQDLNKIPVHMIMTRMPNITYCYERRYLLK